MLTGEISIHEEPFYNNTQTSSSAYSRMNTTDKEVYAAKYATCLKNAKEKLQIGDLIKLEANKAYAKHKVITGFCETVEDTIAYCNDVCVVYLRDENMPTQQPLRYSLSELDMSTLIKANTENLPVKVSNVVHISGELE